LTYKEKIIDILEDNTHLEGEVVHESIFDDVADLILEVLGSKSDFEPIVTAKIASSHTVEYVNMLLVNAVRNLTEEQRHDLTIALIQRDAKIQDALK
jgi:phage gp37-like protein